MSKKYKSRGCCVPQCSSTEVKNPELKFYRFPGRYYEVERKRKWIISVRRKSINGKTEWAPTSNTRICSRHFLGGKRSENPKDEAYNPTIFPWKKENPETMRRIKRLTERNQRKNFGVESEVGSNDNQIVDCNRVHDMACNEDIGSHIPVKYFAEIGVQTDFDFISSDEQPISLLFCSFDTSQREVSTQTNIVVGKKIKEEKF